MENKNIVLIKHHFLNKVDVTTSVYTNQVEEHDLSDYTIVNVTQRCKTWGNLSPMKLGPVTSYDGKDCKIFEEFYQCSKVYPCMDDNGRPNAQYFKWRDECYNHDLTTHTARELRHPQFNAHPESPKKHYEHNDCVYAVYFDEDKNKLVSTNSYVETRKKIYIKGYAHLVTKTEEFKELKRLIDEGKKIAILDFDCYNYYSDEVKMKEYKKYEKKCKDNGIEVERTPADYLNIKTMKDVINCPFLLAGHGVVIKALLQGDLEVKNGKLIDNIGIL